jgi:ribosome-binding factor A
MLGYKRTDRVGDQIRLEVADILTRRMKDPRVGFVTITSVDLSADLRQAWVYVTVLQEGEQGNEAMATLARASGFIRGELGRRLKLRYVPELTFMRDRSVDQVRHVMSLIDTLHPDPPDKNTASDAGKENHYISPGDAADAGDCDHRENGPKGQEQ